jgi:RimJ/RimL family protein N-acetyltransferase
MLRSASEDDVETIRAWRNQEPNRLVSISSHEIGAEEHAAWWARTRVDPTRRVLVYERDGVPAGVVNFFDLDGTTGGWGFYLDAEGLAARGETLPAWLEIMREAVDYAFDELRLAELRGEVLEHNTAERRDADGRTIVVIPIALNRENRRPR